MNPFFIDLRPYLSEKLFLRAIPPLRSVTALGKGATDIEQACQIRQVMIAIDRLKRVSNDAFSVLQIMVDEGPMGQQALDKRFPRCMVESFT